MRNRQILVATILIIGGLTGAIQTKKFVGSLTTSDGASLAEKNGRLVLVYDRRGSNVQLDVLNVWKISSPYLQTAKGRYLAIDQSEDEVKVFLTEKPADSAKWGIEVLETTSPTRPTKGSIDERRMLVGTSESRFRLSLADGRFKGFYLAANIPNEESVPKGTLPTMLTFKVVKDPKSALTFDYVDTTYAIDHK